jgi:MSHA pilin protein MshC
VSITERHISRVTDSGFTLIEVIIVLVIMAIITAIAINHGMSQRVELMAQTEVLKTHLRFAQSRAMNADQIWGIQIRTALGVNTYRLYQYDGALNVFRLPGEPADDVNLSAKNLSASPLGYYSFDGRGVPYFSASGPPPGDALNDLADPEKTISITDGTAPQDIAIRRNTGFIR